MTDMFMISQGMYTSEGDTANIPSHLNSFYIYSLWICVPSFQGQSDPLALRKSHPQGRSSPCSNLFSFWWTRPTCGVPSHCVRTVPAKRT